MSELVLSLTVYYERFKHNLNTIIPFIFDAEIQAQLEIACQLIAKGQMLEQQTSPFALKKIGEEMGEVANALGKMAGVTIEGKTRQYALPEVENKEGLLFALILYQHLNDYQYVSYAGPITTYLFKDVRQLINENINAKKPWIHAQADILKKRIISFCHNQQLDAVLLMSIFKENEREKLTTEIARFFKPTSAVTSSSTSILEPLKELTEKERTAYEKVRNEYERWCQHYTVYQNAKKELLTAKGLSLYFTFLPFSSLSSIKTHYQQALAQLKRLLPEGKEHEQYTDELAQQVKTQKLCYEKQLWHYLLEKNRLSRAVDLNTQVVVTAGNSTVAKISPKPASHGFFDHAPTKEVAIAAVAVATAAVGLGTYAWLS